jgi:hypothetical protein
MKYLNLFESFISDESGNITKERDVPIGVSSDVKKVTDYIYDYIISTIDGNGGYDNFYKIISNTPSNKLLSITIDIDNTYNFPLSGVRIFFNKNVKNQFLEDLSIALSNQKTGKTKLLKNALWAVINLDIFNVTEWSIDKNKEFFYTNLYHELSHAFKWARRIISNSKDNTNPLSLIFKNSDFYFENENEDIKWNNFTDFFYFLYKEEADNNLADIVHSQSNIEAKIKMMINFDANKYNYDFSKFNFSNTPLGKWENFSRWFVLKYEDICKHFSINKDNKIINLKNKSSLELLKFFEKEIKDTGNKMFKKMYKIQSSIKKP